MTDLSTSSAPRRGRPLLARAAITMVVAALLLSIPGSALAAKSGGGGGAAGAMVTASPNPVTAGAALTVSGTGYRASSQLQVKFVTSSSVGYIYAASDASGAFSFQTSLMSTGTVQISVYQASTKGFTLVASTSVVVR